MFKRVVILHVGLLSLLVCMGTIATVPNLSGSYVPENIENITLQRSVFCVYS